ncbi:MAG: cyclic peptide export ABC transporter [Deltaproteobacteria bacterium]|nr:cyclic peptide export ABC transporter [Deltaproteobacteria bacterium]
MVLIRFLLKESNASLYSLGGMAVLSGIMSVVLLAIINVAAASVEDQQSTTRFLFLFAIALAMYILAEKSLLVSSTTLVETILKDLRERLTNKIRYAELLPLEGIGRARIYASVNTEIQAISQTTQPMIHACQAACLVLFSLVYLGYISLIALLLMLVLTAVGLSIHFHRMREMSDSLKEAFVRDNRFFEALTHILDGFKEVKMHESRSRDLALHVQDASAAVADLKISIGTRFANDFAISQTIFYLVVGGIVFLVPQLSATYSSVVMKATATILFIIGPLTNLIGTLPLFGQAGVAIERIYELERQLDSYVDARAGQNGESPAVSLVKAFECIDFSGVTFQYTDRQGFPLFTVGPLDLHIQSGETVFIVGGNGSGKSTFLKLLTTLYYPPAGQIQLDGAPLTTDTYARYRNLFSIIFSDFHLFDRLYGLPDVDPTRVEHLLQFLEIQDKTSFVDGRFVNQELSSGQRKRLALLVTLLEDRPIQVFDEWAADQDPIFRRYFYEHILLDMKRQGKTIIVATHDDRYFHVADRVLKMESGKFVTM